MNVSNGRILARVLNLAADVIADQPAAAALIARRLAGAVDAEISDQEERQERERQQRVRAGHSY